jgi:hypothetical protein
MVSPLSPTWPLSWRMNFTLAPAAGHESWPETVTVASRVTSPPLGGPVTESNLNRHLLTCVSGLSPGLGPGLV